MLRGTSMWPTFRSRAPRPQLRRTAQMCMSCPSRRSPCPWPSSRVAQVSGSVSPYCVLESTGCGSPRTRFWQWIRWGMGTQGAYAVEASSHLHLRLAVLDPDSLLDLVVSCQQA